MTTSTTDAHDFTVTVAPSGRTFTVSSSETVLAAAIRQEIGLPYGCRDGACGACKCKMLSGQVAHEPYNANALSAEEQAAGYILTCRAQAQEDLQLESRQVTPHGAFPVKKMPARVSQLQRMTPDVVVLQLQLPAHDRLHYLAGQYIDVLLRDGKRRSYSMASPGSDANTLELHIRHMPGGAFTDHVFGSMQEKEILRIEGPFGSFYLHPESPLDIVLLTSGTGFAPIKALLESMQQQNLTRPTSLYWGGRRPGDLYLHAWVEQFAQNHSWLRYIPVLSDLEPTDIWSGRRGLVHQAVLQDHPDLRAHQVYACGAPVMVDAARRDFAAAGLDTDHFYADAFITQADLAA